MQEQLNRMEAKLDQVLGNQKVMMEGTPTPGNPAGQYDPNSTDFYWEATGFPLQVVTNPNSEVFRNTAPPAGWSGSLEFQIGLKPGNEADQVMCRFVGQGGVILHEDKEWAKLDSYHMPLNGVSGPVTVFMKTEKRGAFDIHCLHQP